MKPVLLTLFLFAAVGQFSANRQATSQQASGDTIGLYRPVAHDLYDGRFSIEGKKIYQVGGLYDSAPWDHMGNNGKNVQAVGGNAEIDVNEIENTGRFRARLRLPEGRLDFEMERFHEFTPCQDGGIAAYLYEHGDSGCGDTNWPKTFGYLAGWGYGKATLDGAPLYEDYEIHFMVTQGIRDRKTFEVRYPMADKKSAAGEVNPATQQIDFYIRSPETDERNHPKRKSFDHFFAMEVTWK